MTSLHADDAFLNYYQFSHDPFTPRVPGFKFYPAQRKSVLGQLHHLARYGQLLLLITGPKGSGKTLLRQALVASTNKQCVQSLVLSGREAADRGDLLKQLATAIQSSSTSVDSILARAGQLALTGQEVYLLIDDAGLLEDGALHALLDLAAGNGEGRMHVFLFAEEELARRLAPIAPTEESFHVIALQPYTDSETREYLSLRLEGAGQSIDLLTDEQVDDIHTLSNGWPGSINQVARDTMLDAMLADRRGSGSGGFSGGLPKKHLIALFVVCVSVAAAWFISSKPADSEQAPSITVQAPSAADGQSIQFNQAPQSDSPAPQAQPVIREPLAQASVENDSEEPSVVAEKVGVEMQSVAEAQQIQPAAVPLPLPVAPSAPIPQVSDTVEPITRSEGEPKVLKEVPSAPHQAIDQQPHKVPALSQAVVTKVEPQPVAVPTALPSGADWYRSQAPGRVALQILGTRSEGSAKAFVQQHGSEYRYYMKMYQGAPMYVVTYGVFSSQSAAQAAVKGLPAKVLAGKPWPKSFAVIQQEMVKGH